MAAEAQKVREAAVFRDFVADAGLTITPDSLEQPGSPAPDIRCRIDGIGPCDFEITEIIDPDFAERRTILGRMHLALRDPWQFTDAETRMRVEASHRSSDISISFRDRVSLRQRERVLRDVMTYLANLPMQLERREIEDRDELPSPLLDSIAIHPVRNHDGPTFSSPVGGWVGDPIEGALLRKLERRYAIRHRVELLAFFDQHPVLPPDIWIDATRDYLKEKLPESQFTRVWIYDWPNRIVCLSVARGVD